ncbi:MAG: hypothetical protein LV480_08085 [Methylacidiphilales bacterium]|nr:hypothetical protein [Candidatus Methylacidiphilales bacterium]
MRSQVVLGNEGSNRFERFTITGGITIIAAVVFYIMLFQSLDYVGKKVGPRLEQLENQGPQ